MSDFTLFHNPRCSKSRAALALLERRGIELVIVDYLKNPPSAAELRAVIAKLGIRPEELVRKGEETYKSTYAGKSLSDAEWIEAMSKHPILIERPILVRGKYAVLGRPTENIEQFLEHKA